MRTPAAANLKFPRSASRPLPSDRSKPLGKPVIPKVVQIARAESGRRHLLPIAAGIVIVGRMKRLVHVADEMHEELQGDQALSRTRCRIAKFCCEFLDFVDNASLRRPARCRHARGQRRMAEASPVEVAAVEFDIDKTPLPRLQASSVNYFNPGDDDRNPGQRAEQKSAPYVPARRELLKIRREPFDRDRLQNPAWRRVWRRVHIKLVFVLADGMTGYGCSTV